MENPYDHLASFERLCNTFRIQGVPDDSIKLILFPFSLGERASQWERMLPSHLVESWKDCKELFLNKFYPIQRTIRARRDILNFEQSLHESFSEAWNRLKGYTRDCPHHGFGDGELLSIFYRGVLKEHKWTLDAASNGSFSKLQVDQGELLVENLSMSFEGYLEDEDEPTLEEPCQDAHLKTFQEELGMRESLMSVQQQEVHSVQQDHQSKVDLGAMHRDNIQEQWPSHEVQEDQQYLEMRTMLQQLLTGQTKAIKEFHEMEEKVAALSSELILLKHENAQECSLPSRLITEATKDDNEEFLQENDRKLNESQDKELKGDCKVEAHEKVEVEAPRVEYMGSYSTMHVVSPPKASLKKKGHCEEKALGYGNVESMMALDGYSLDSLFSPTIEEEVDKTKEEISNSNHSTLIEPFPRTFTLNPWKYIDGAIEYKVKCNGQARPFAKVRALLSNELKEKGESGIQEAMSRVILPDFGDPPWSVLTPSSTK